MIVSKREDLRIKKTYNTLITAMLNLLKKKNFNQITVNEICCEALISRATFYVHFNDKYDLLKYWLSDLNKLLIPDVNSYKILETSVNQFIHNNKNIIANVLIDANNETSDLVNNFVAKIIDGIIAKYGNAEKKNAAVLSDFCTGGIINMISLLVKQHFPENNNMMTFFLFDMIKNIMVWAHDKTE